MVSIKTIMGTAKEAICLHLNVLTENTTTKLKDVLIAQINVQHVKTVKFATLVSPFSLFQMAMSAFPSVEMDKSSDLDKNAMIPTKLTVTGAALSAKFNLTMFAQDSRLSVLLKM